MSLSRSEQSRINGAKSKGPTSEAGKRRSSQNARKHGAYANHAVCLSNEDRIAFDLQLQAYVQRFAPSDPYELNLVHELHTIDWVLVRTRAVDANLLNLEMTRQFPEFADNPNFPELSRLALAQRHLVDNSRLPGHLARTVAQLLRNRRATLADLVAVRKNFPIPERTQDLQLVQPLDPANEPASSSPPAGPDALGCPGA